MQVEVAYAEPDSQTIIKVTVADDCTAIDAVTASGILQQYTQLQHQNLELGIFGHAVKHDHLLEPGDRVEIYRPLTLDPKDLRRRREKQQS